jgi:hypothetical protein
MKLAVLYHTSQAAKTRHEILSIAVDIASAEGLEGVSIGRLATELKMSKTACGASSVVGLSFLDAAERVGAPRNRRPLVGTAVCIPLFASVSTKSLAIVVHKHHRNLVHCKFCDLGVADTADKKAIQDRGCGFRKGTGVW